MQITFKKDINNADKFVRLCSAYAEELGVASCAGYDDLEVDIKTNDSKLADRFYEAVKQAGFAKR